MLLHLFLLFSSCTAVIVDTKYGKVKGYPFTSRNQRQVWSFSGIPYAKPPLGHLRFMEPQPPTSYGRVIDANVSTACFPSGYTLGAETSGAPIGEDCLQLAVFTPSLNSTTLYPVMVWIHGGFWVADSGESEYGAQFFMDHDIVVVQVEFRLSVLGLLTLENKVMPGNMELKDQSLALKWVQENIAFFKGDPNKVTLLGQSSGSASVNYHMISPLSRGLFHAAICASGEAVAPWALAVPGASRKYAILIALSLNCFSNNDTKILLCLQNKNVLELVKINTNAQLYPVMDNYSPDPFIPENPHQMESAPVPFITGVNNIDGYVAALGIVNNIFLLGGFNILFDVYASPYLLYQYITDLKKRTEVSNRIRQFYFDGRPITKKSLGNLTNMFSDRYFFWPLLEALNLHKGPTYVYNDAYNDSVSFKTPGYPLTGSVHGDTTLLLWQQKGFDLNQNATNLSERLVKIFVDFIKYGTPTPPGSSSFQWPLWDNKTQPFITIDTYGNFREDHGFYTDRMKFWQQLHNFAPDIDKY